MYKNVSSQSVTPDPSLNSHLIYSLTFSGTNSIISDVQISAATHTLCHSPCAQIQQPRVVQAAASEKQNGERQRITPTCIQLSSQRTKQPPSYERIPV